jgi:hypothetical protein
LTDVTDIEHHQAAVRIEGIESCSLEPIDAGLLDGALVRGVAAAGRRGRPLLELPDELAPPAPASWPPEPPG